MHPRDRPIEASLQRVYGMLPSVESSRRVLQIQLGLGARIERGDSAGELILEGGGIGAGRSSRPARRRPLRGDRPNLAIRYPVHAVQ